jgi:Ca2+-binding RTX toxin-like protein
MLLMATMGATVLLMSGVAYALTVQCDGAGDQDPAAGQCRGTLGDDDITGTDQKDSIVALRGFDDVLAGGGADEISGGILDDNLQGEEGNDTYWGGNGADDLSEYGNFSGELSGDDEMNGGYGPDFLEGNEGADVLRGDEGDDDGMYGDEGNDKLFGGPDEDEMEGEEGADELYGGPDDDWIDAADEETADTPDTVNGGLGFDVCIVNQNDRVFNCEAISPYPNPTPAAAARATEDSTGNR